MYRLLFNLLLRHLEPERAHALAHRTLRLTRGTGVLARLAEAPDPCLRTQALGLTFPSPVGVAAGLDKDATWFDELTALGFGFVEVGTVTPEPQEGNPRPRIARVVNQRALVNRMGFPNAGAEAAAARLTARRFGAVVGANVGKSRNTPEESAAADYAAAVRTLAPSADYVVVNVSSPNTPGLRALQAANLLKPILERVRSELEATGRRLPLLVKLAPDLEDSELEEIVRVALELKIDGIVAVNTSSDRSLVAGEVPFEGGGVSGAPLRPRAVEVLRCLRVLAGPDLTLISVGGIETADDVWARIRAGATLVQAYTAFVYGGPGWPSRVNRDLAARVRAAGGSSIQDFVGQETAADQEARTDASFTNP